jgi:hypothetical protein
VEQSSPSGLVVKSGGLEYGALRREMYRGIPGSTLTDFTSHPKYPAQADEVDVVHSWEQPRFLMPGVGVRLSGYLVPKISGNYVFYLCADEQGALFLSRDDSPQNKRQIAFEPGWNWPRTWTGTDRRSAKENVSAEIPLEAGKRYYIESIVLNSNVSGNLGVAWQLPGQSPPRNGSPPIGGEYLAVPNGTPATFTASRGSGQP